MGKATSGATEGERGRAQAYPGRIGELESSKDHYETACSGAGIPFRWKQKTVPSNSGGGVKNRCGLGGNRLRRTYRQVARR